MGNGTSEDSRDDETINDILLHYSRFDSLPIYTGLLLLSDIKPFEFDNFNVRGNGIWFDNQFLIEIISIYGMTLASNDVWNRDLMDTDEDFSIKCLEVLQGFLTLDSYWSSVIRNYEPTDLKYFVNWAISKKIPISWEKHAIKLGIIEPTTTAQNEKYILEKEISKRERNTYENIIGAMLNIMLNKPLPKNSNQTTLITTLIEDYGNAQGLKKSTLENKFVEAKSAIKQTYPDLFSNPNKGK